jgi:ribosomal protein L44E
MERNAPEKRAVSGLVCLECEAESSLARGWRAYLDAEASLLVYCPQCAAREFDA